jgi:hypothetical protein
VAQPTTETGDYFPPFTGAALLVDSGRPTATHLRRWCWGGTLEHGEPVGGGRV